jgi:hypothetical protein
MTQCDRCDGCGRIANSEDQEPWTDWTNLPAHSQLAIRIGLVVPITCPDCGGTGHLPKFIQVSRSDAVGVYTVDRKGLLNVIDSEFDDMEYEDNYVVFLKVVEMPLDDFDNLPEFEGW